MNDAKTVTTNQLREMPVEELLDDMYSATFDIAVCQIAFDAFSSDEVVPLNDGTTMSFDELRERMDKNAQAYNVIRTELIRRIGDQQCLNFFTRRAVM